ncbi:MAG: nicotinate (nicotinamide) nucleotide adenylyltransferase [Bacteroidota bacterium]|nr:nicotinate (nicotinamide) nucleotide adenylyltransferase [Bacteroidota bacterium]
MKIGLLFGSFNPIHIGHLIIANTMVDLANLDEVWLVVTPLNPFKNKKELLDENERLKMVNLAIANNPRLKSSDIEFNLPKPNYSIDTLMYMKNTYPEHIFYLVIGEDNLVKFDQWKDYNEIFENFEVLVYPRPYTPNTQLKIHPRVHIFNCPLLDISSTYIRENIKYNKSIKYLVHEGVEKYILEKLKIK